MVALQADLVIPELTDALLAKWAGHAVLGTTSAIVLYSAGKSILNPNLEGTTTSRGVPWTGDIVGIDNNRYNPFDNKPPKWFWPLAGGVMGYELYQNWPSPSIQQPDAPVDNTYVAPSPLNYKLKP